MHNTKILKIIFDRTDGHCHFCGDTIFFKKYGLKNVSDTAGVWEADHIKQKGKGGTKSAANCLPACYRCNRLRWHRKGDDIRELLFLGLITQEQIRKKNKIGAELLKLKEKRLHNNKKRRRSL